MRQYVSALGSFLQGFASDRSRRSYRPPTTVINQVVGKRRHQRRRYTVAIALCFSPGNELWSSSFIHDEVMLSATAAQLMRKHALQRLQHDVARAIPRSHTIDAVSYAMDAKAWATGRISPERNFATFSRMSTPDLPNIQHIPYEQWKKKP